MNVETLIYAYLAICTAMIIFNCACVFVFRSQSRGRRHLSVQLKSTILAQLLRINSGQAVEDGHLDILRRRLSRCSHLLALDEALEELIKEEAPGTDAYIRAIRPVFISLAVKNRYRGAMEMACYGYMIKKYAIIQGVPDVIVLGAMERLLTEPSLYCRESALQAIYSSGDIPAVIRALKYVDISGRFHHAKLLTDGLLEFNGDRGRLAQALWEHFDSFSVPMQVVILDFIRFGGSQLGPQLLSLLADGRRDDEVRFSCIRYFAKYPCQEAYPLLLSFVECPRERRWEYAAISATALASYPGERSAAALKRALNSPVWYIRFNAAKSLESFGLTYLDLSDVMDSRDRYAREILQFQFDMQSAAEKRKEGAAV